MLPYMSMWLYFDWQFFFVTTLLLTDTFNDNVEMLKVFSFKNLSLWKSLNYKGETHNIFNIYSISYNYPTWSSSALKEEGALLGQNKFTIGKNQLFRYFIDLLKITMLVSYLSRIIPPWVSTYVFSNNSVFFFLTVF